MNNQHSIPNDAARLERIHRIVQQIAELESELEAIFGVEVDAVLLPATATPLLLQQTQQALLKSQEELRRANETLEQRVAERTEELQQTLEELETQSEELRVQTDELLAGQARIHESEVRMQAIIDGAPAIVFMKDLQGRFITINTRLEKLLGMTREEIRGKTDYDVYRKEAADYYREHDLRVLRGGEPVVLEEEADLVDGHHTLLANKFPLVDADGVPYAMVGISTDITDRKRAEAERERLLGEVEQHAAELESTIAAIADGVVIYDAKGDIVRLNRTAERMIGYSSEDLSVPMPERKGWNRLERFDGTPMPLEETATWRALHGETTSGSLNIFVLPDGRRIHITTSGAPIRAADGRFIGAVITFTDVTPLHALQEQQRVLMHMVSHDLRTPLTIIMGHAELMADRVSEDLPLGKDVATIRRNARRLNAMIEDLTEMARLEGGQLKLQREPVPLTAYLPELLERLTGALAIDRIRLDVPEDLPPILADVNRLDRIMTNLLSNALKYSDPSTPIELRAHRDDGKVTIAVTDHGQGILPDDLPHLFERFYRAKSTRKAEGIGLGLYITRLLVEALGGHIRAESEPGKGSTFTVTLPKEE